MRRVHAVLSDRATEQLDELREFWRDAMGETPSPDMLIQRALAELHHTYVVSSAAGWGSAKKVAAMTSSLNPAGLARRSKAS